MKDLIKKLMFWLFAPKKDDITLIAPMYNKISESNGVHKGYCQVRKRVNTKYVKFVGARCIYRVTRCKHYSDFGTTCSDMDYTETGYIIHDARMDGQVRRA
jgi:hypothetical protein